MCPLLLKRTQNKYTRFYIEASIKAFQKQSVDHCKLRSFWQLFRSLRCLMRGRAGGACRVERISARNWNISSPTSEGYMLCWKLCWMDDGYSCLPKYIYILTIYRSKCTPSYLERRRPVTGVRKYQTSLRSSLIIQDDARDSTPNGTIYDLDQRGKSIQFNN